MSSLAASLVPVFLVILVGCATKLIGVLDRAAWDGFERVTYYILFPALLGGTLAMTDLRSVPALSLGATLSASVLTMAALLLAAAPLLRQWAKIDGPAFCSLFQGATRWNSFVAIAMALNLYGKEGVALAAVAAVAMVPLLNICATLVHSYYGAGKRLNGAAFLRSLAANPFIWAPLLGLAWSLSGVTMPGVFATSIDVMGRAALAAGLLCVGAGLEISGLHRPRPALLISLALKLLIMPLFALFWARTFGVQGTALAIAMLSASVPTASGSYLLARQLGGDAPLMAEILTVQTLVAMVTMPLMMQLGV
ncbi:AEC family transporter [Terrarubrum flagellatum]|uniref:AEC family transporter n=1 Tax=Terrirubrum flagellatum TaxID=2895980 RepID=UPI00314542A2